MGEYTLKGHRSTKLHGRPRLALWLVPKQLNLQPKTMVDKATYGAPNNGITILYRGPYMSDHVLLNLINKFGKRDKMRACRAFICFRNEFDKFNNTRARMLDSIYHMALRLL